MAHVYIPLLLTAQPRGQFRLGGYCNGGLLAWEIAHRLHHAGREVESVTLINTFSLNARPLLRGFNRLLCGLTPFVQPSTSRSRVGRSLMSALWKLGGRGRIGLRGPPKWSRPASEASISRRSVTRAMRHTCAMANFIPPKLNCVVAVVCEDDADLFDRSTSPWTRIARDVRHAIVPGDHATCVRAHVEALAESLNANALNVQRPSEKGVVRS
jgi:thioesterase domain-containing protein